MTDCPCLIPFISVIGAIFLFFVVFFLYNFLKIFNKEELAAIFLSSAYFPAVWYLDLLNRIFPGYEHMTAAVTESWLSAGWIALIAIFCIAVGAIILLIFKMKNASDRFVLSAVLIVLIMMHSVMLTVTSFEVSEYLRKVIMVTLSLPALGGSFMALFFYKREKEGKYRENYNL